MRDGVLYTTRYNLATRRPARDHAWVPPDEAERLVRAGEGIEVVDASRRDTDGALTPLWLVGLAASGAIRVQLLSPAGSVVRVSDYEVVDGRLWRSSSSDYDYADDSGRHRLAEAHLTVRTTRAPDGTGTLSIKDGASAPTHVASFTDIPTEGGWLDIPAFGDWGPVVDATMGPTPDVPA